MVSAPPPYRVLSLDGGGMRGTYTATYLDQVARTFARRRGVETLDIGAGFDLIVGTSTGGIIACGLAKGVPLGKVVDLYRVHGPSIFNRRLPEGSFSKMLPRLIADVFKRPAALTEGDAALRKALQDVLEETTVFDIYEQRGIALAITAVEMSQHRAWVFKTPHFGATNHRDDKYPLVDVCLATSAAPIFRSMASIDHPEGTNTHHVFVDGGLWANNPVVVGLVEALDVAAPDQPIEIFSLGTCPLPAGEQIARADVNRGLPGWKFGGDAASLAIDAQQFAYDHMAKKLASQITKSSGRKCTVVRFPAEKVPAALIPYLGLDDTRHEAIEALIRQAQTDADMTNSKCTYRDTDPEAALICDLFNAMPPLTDPLFKRPVPLSQGPTAVQPAGKDADDV
ncbi:MULTISPECIES: CBASS cGAMP-activated phospholipase [Thalassospira]|uniref:CBASS cGAMP-activated phospholipase n=1 Tax=Thalassospira TaxID=168934 RepID=UPI000827AB40|nr:MULTISPECIES: CBASS cGAMP-activated phospholipase [Thalassospira]OCK09689.1 Patatin [Thalassospira sp. KO164]SEE79820.1 Patatin-like phospholipase [Thalassospira permensis]